ncbi:helix-turn-helix domain-containing protein [Mycobacteroides abscessus]|uniref:helix-turn-helix domain-containing protein n=1 Tax=Mycobacteroides abscessus TaxID=36809 RepID=UPI00092A3605|nr:helix-turn-helix domain-containing protein [Mycobacteroides abscessus]SHR97831.1 DNA binding domain, excisionase family [Mycobacteroides abscessus subsp. abscessus]
MEETPIEIEIDPARFMTMAEVAAMWNTSVDTVRRRVRSGALPSIQVGRGVRIAREDALKGAK